MSSIAIKRELTSGTVDQAIDKVTELLKKEGFGVLTRIDFHSKMKEKLGKDLKPTVILGACNPTLAFEAFSANPDVTALLPCNVVVREVGGGHVSVELARPSAMMEFIKDPKLVGLAKEADQKLERVAQSL